MPSPSATLSTLQVGTYNPTLDTWTSVLDLNDRSNFYIRAQGLKLNQPEKVYVTSFTIRAPGERVNRRQYKNRHVLASIWIHGANTAAITTNVRNLLSAIEQPPYRLKLALPGASGFSYADCVKVTHNIPSDAQEILGGAINHVEIDFECLPGLSADQAAGGTRVTLSNLLMNPGFEAPSGLGQTVFADQFVNFNPYVVQSGGALVQDKFQYADTVLADTPLHYYRLDETSGSTFYDAMASGQNGTLNGGVTQGSTGLLTSDTDKAATFNGTTGYIALTNAGTWPTGNGAWTIECWCKPTNSTNAGNATLVAIGNPGTNSQAGEIAQTSTGGWTVATWGGVGHDFNGNGTSTAGTTYHVVATYDGASHLDLYVNNVHFGTFNPGTLNLSSSHQSIGDSWNGSVQALFFPGVIDEVAIYNTALSSGRVSAHYTAGTTTPSTTADTMQIPSGGRVSFGSPAWATLNMWQIRFRWITSLTATFYLHYTDANNYLAVTISGTTLSLVHVVASVSNTLGTQSINLTNGMQYWLQMTQYPNVNTSPMPQAQVVLRADSGGAVSVPSATLTTIASVALASASVAVSGSPQIAASGAALGLGGNFGSVHLVKLFGPSGWSFSSSGAGTTTAAAWDQNTANTYPNGPFTSFAAARIDAPPTGNWSANWSSFGLLNGAGAANLAPAANGQVMAGAAWGKSSGGGASLNIQCIGNEYDSGGNFLRSTTLQTLTGNQSSWVQVSGTWTAGASCAFAGLEVLASDSTSGSANAIVWIDNTQLWNQTRTGQTTMPYCELRFPAAPAQLLISGLIGDIAAPAYVACGIWLSSLATNSTVTFGIGRRAAPSAGAQLVGIVQVFNGLANAVLDSNSYGGYYLATASNATAVEYDPPTSTSATSGTAAQTVNNLLGTWHFFERAQSSQATIANVTARLNAGAPGPWVAYGSQITPLTTASTWTMTDTGQVAFPIGPLGAIAQNPATLNVNASTQWADSTGGGSTMSAGWYAYVPVDTNLLYGTIINPSNAGGAITNTWFFVYSDALGPQSQVGVPTRQSQETTALDAPFGATGGPGTTTSTYPNVNGVGDPYLTIDPTTSANTSGVNQLVIVAADNAGTVLPVAVEIRYAPQYLFPK